jgi:hypothetical protein
MAIASPPQTLLDKIVAATQDRLAVLGQRRAEGMDTLAWRLQTQAVLKDSHIAAAALARGGFDNLTKADYGVIGSRLRFQYDRLAVLGLDTAPGAFGARDMARLAMYGAAARGTAADMTHRGAVAEGAAECQNVLGGGESCDECLAETARGWVAADDMSLPGERTCLSNCQCTLDYRGAGEAA